MHAVLIQRAGCKIGGRKFPADTVLADLHFRDGQDVARIAQVMAPIAGLSVVIAGPAPARASRATRTPRAAAPATPTPAPAATTVAPLADA